MFQIFPSDIKKEHLVRVADSIFRILQSNGLLLMTILDPEPEFMEVMSNVSQDLALANNYRQIFFRAISPSPVGESVLETPIGYYALICVK